MAISSGRSATAACCNALADAGKRLVFYCAFGERSAMAVRAAQDSGLAASHIEGGLDAWEEDRRRDRAGA